MIVHSTHKQRYKIPAFLCPCQTDLITSIIRGTLHTFNFFVFLSSVSVYTKFCKRSDQS